MRQSFATRMAAHRAGGYVASQVEAVAIQVESRLQLRALEQVRILFARSQGSQVANRINAMSEKTWEKVGRDLVERWFQRNSATGPRQLVDEVDDILNVFDDLATFFI